MKTGNAPHVENITAGIITTRYIGPTNFRGSRVKAVSGSGKSLTFSYDAALDERGNHAAAAAALAVKVLDVSPDAITLVGGCLPADGGYAFAILRK